MQWNVVIRVIRHFQKQYTPPFVHFLIISPPTVHPHCASNYALASTCTTQSPPCIGTILHVFYAETPANRYYKNICERRFAAPSEKVSTAPLERIRKMSIK